MKRIIEVTVSPEGAVEINAVEFKGADCEKATRFLEEALGQITTRTQKPEYRQSQHKTQQQRIGQ